MNLARPLSVLVLTLLLGSSEPALAQAEYKYHKQLVFDDVLHAEWTYIGTPGGSPYKARLLYKDGTGHLLVIRTLRGGGSGALNSIEHPATQELMTFQKPSSADSMTVALGAQQVVITLSEVAAVSTDELVFPAAVKAQASSLLATASPEFRDALRQLALVACGSSADLHRIGALYAHLFYDDIACGTPPRSLKQAPVTAEVKAFDANQTQPDAFDSLFGQHYFE
jgi:hypothetical protein